MSLTPVSLADTFDVWRIRTNQIITSLQSAESNVSNISSATTVVNTATQAAFTKANSANFFAYLVNANTVAAFDYANSSYVTLNTAIAAAFNKANTGDTTGSSAFDKANSANVLAYSSGLTGSAAFDKANTANAIAVGAFEKANVAGGGYYKGNNGNVGSANNKNDIFRVNTSNVTSNLTFAAWENASATGPLYLDTNVMITIEENARVVIL